MASALPFFRWKERNRRAILKCLAPHAITASGQYDQNKQSLKQSHLAMPQSLNIAGHPTANPWPFTTPMDQRIQIGIAARLAQSRSMVAQSASLPISPRQPVPSSGRLTAHRLPFFRESG